MFINSKGCYIPTKRVTNSYFAKLNDLSEDWYFKRTGILTRARASEEETIDYMSIKAVEDAVKNLPYDISEVDLIVFASYTPNDTVGTTAHIIQKEFNINNAKAFYISSACSSAINGMEIINSFFKSKISSKALLISADRNSSYSDDKDIQSGHLWGDAAVALFFSSEPMRPNEAEVIDINTLGLGNIGYGPKAVTMEPKNGLHMPYGKDVFTQACIYLTKLTDAIIKKNGYTISDLTYFIGHQANKRILNNVCHELGLDENKSLTNVEELGNTGCASAPLVFAQNYDIFKEGDLVCLSVFGGGYSCGTCLIKFN
ncbi:MULTISPECIES: 3-oxoacyl-ACP synthase III family protein [unclassified Apibacter]|uniref:3-oxoacyl-ACP synthase III family protein n=1 Tax=unclassified Apibacter TaxID=2630820 RepID=UPI0013280AC3|nr:MULTISPECIES: ketoacyl-ACP synthase III [unclassified Apibacter]MCX8676945.1 ketoacyl-ACP synthase III [Apibacter sp. B3919]MXO24673.1 ketoacyl-ACP synthase III [Apibacter sp. B3924]MXO25917.1 ketoacyl-ACP synthase III [Apibacter sp. B3813]MXO27868.1 ketoacyl-ACP synthase III [Apibacter sp. B3913]MXO29772.1 ketoacyl-ACP synthase III [Apibacter sp. B3912]